jgi:hypothetical protein
MHNGLISYLGLGAMTHGFILDNYIKKIFVLPVAFGKPI